MAVASGPTGPVLAGPVFTVIFGTAYAQIMNNWGEPEEAPHCADVWVYGATDHPLTSKRVW